MRGATRSSSVITNYSSSISIYAPHAGCDPAEPRIDRIRIISIHAPHVGCDEKDLIEIVSPSGFQSTHPMRGATKWADESKITALNFNPRTPCGVRLRQVVKPNILY